MTASETEPDEGSRVTFMDWNARARPRSLSASGLTENL